MLTVICAWCKIVIKYGNSKEISHGMCETCAKHFTEILK